MTGSCLVDVLNAGEDALFEFLFAGNADMTQHGLGELG